MIGFTTKSQRHEGDLDDTMYTMFLGVFVPLW
jgi:hypothetical protein